MLTGRNRGRWLTGSLLAIALTAAPATAQQGNIAGRVVNAESGAPLQGAAVAVIGVEGLQGTNQTGQFQWSVPEGTYSIVVTMIGHETGRLDGIRVTAGETTVVELALRSRAEVLNPIVVTASRRQEKALEAPTSVSTVSSAEIAKIAAPSVTEHVKALPGVDLAQTGLTQTNVVARGFNNVFSGALLTIQDNRYARVPSLRFNANNMIPATDLDIERIEVSLGPGAALYGPNAASGVMHIITTSPIDNPGSTVSLAGGERSVFHGQFRTAVAPSDRWGLKVSGQYFRGDDWEYVDPLETLAQQANPTNPLIGARNFEAERYSVDARLDFRFDDDAELIFNGGLNNLLSSIELTGVGAAQADGWQYRYAQTRFRKGRFFAQAFLNQSEAGDNSFLLQRGTPMVDRSRAVAVQTQHGMDVGERVSLTYGIDWQYTQPRTEGTITGRNEDDDDIREVGAYVHGEAALSDRVDFVAAFRVDDHSRLADVNFSPRVAVVFKPAENQNFRATFNRAFSTPTSNNLFLDLVAGQIPIIPGLIAYDIRTLGVPEGGFTFNDQCTGGLMDYCMRSPFMAGQLPANAALFWNAMVGQLVPAALQPALLDPTAADPMLGTVFRRFDQSAATSGMGDPFPLDIVGISDIGEITSTIYNTFELGYKGLLGDRVVVAADAYYARVEDFVGPLRVETPNVFLDPATVQAFVLGRLGPLIQGGVITQQDAVDIITGFSSVPLGTVVPDQADTPDLLLTYRNFGDVDYWGADLSAQVLVSDRVRLNGSYSFVSEECFDFNEDGSCQSTDDIALNAPTNKGSFGISFDDQTSGFSAQGRVRFSGSFPMNSGVYLGDVDSFAVVDAGIGYRLPFQPSTRVSLNATNLLNNEHREFIGAPEIGRLLLFRVQYDF